MKEELSKKVDDAISGKNDATSGKNEANKDVTSDIEPVSMLIEREYIQT